MRKLPITVFVIGFSVLCFSMSGRSNHLTQISVNDSVKVKNTVEGLYSWYADLIKRQKVNKEFNPTFMKDRNEMTTLDFTRYKAGLLKHGFTDDFIKRKVNDYKPCLNNLITIPYSDFVRFEDLDQFEQIKCDFANGFELTKTMEPHDGAELVSLHLIDKRTVQSKVRFYSTSTEGIKQYEGSALVVLIKSKSGWMINDLN